MPPRRRSSSWWATRWTARAIASSPGNKEREWVFRSHLVSLLIKQIIIINKWSNTYAIRMRAFMCMPQFCSRISGMRFCETSAKDNCNVDEIFLKLVDDVLSKVGRRHDELQRDHLISVILQKSPVYGCNQIWRFISWWYTWQWLLQLDALFLQKLLLHRFLVYS